MTGLRSPFWPRSWEGIAATCVLLVGIALAKVWPDHTRGAIAFCLIVVAYGIVVYLTWTSDPD